MNTTPNPKPEPHPMYPKEQQAAQQQQARNLEEIMDALVMLRMKHKIVNISWAGEKFVIVGSILPDGRYTMQQMKIQGLSKSIIVPPAGLKLKPVEGEDGQ